MTEAKKFMTANERTAKLIKEHGIKGAIIAGFAGDTERMISAFMAEVLPNHFPTLSEEQVFITKLQALFSVGIGGAYIHAKDDNLFSLVIDALHIQIQEVQNLIKLIEEERGIK